MGAIELTDHFTNTKELINDADAYTFAVTSAAGHGSGRFDLTLKRPALEKNALATTQSICGGTLATVQLTNTQKGAFYYVSKSNETTALSAEYFGDGGALTLDVPVSALQTGSNNIVVRTGFKGCSNELLTETPLNFTYTLKPEVLVAEQYFSICEGTAVTLRAETNASNTYRWYEGTLI